MADYTIDDIRKMYRETYIPKLIESLQLSVNELEDKMTIFHLNGKEQEVDGIGKTELDVQKQRMQEKTFEELSYNKRFMLPCKLVKSLTLSEDDFRFKGGFAIKTQNLMDSLVKAAERAYTWVSLGVTRDKDDAAKAHTIPSKNDSASSAGVNSPYSSTNTYIGGILGANLVSRDGVQRELIEFPVQPIMLASGELSTDYFTEYTTAGEIDMEKTNVIPANYVLEGLTAGKETDLTIEKIRAAREALETRHAITSDELMYMMITPHQKSMLYADPRLQKECGWQILKDGMMSEIMGLRLVVSNYVPKVNVGGKWVRTCPVWGKESVGFGMWDSAKMRTYELDQRSYDQIGVDFQAAVGASRLRDDAVLAIHCLE